MLSRSGSFVVFHEGPQRAAGMPNLGSAVDIQGKPLSNSAQSLNDHDEAGWRRPANPSFGPTHQNHLMMSPNIALLPFQASSPFSKPGSRNLSSASSGRSVNSRRPASVGNPFAVEYSFPSSRASSRGGRNVMTPPAAGVQYNVDYVGSKGKFLGM